MIAPSSVQLLWNRLFSVRLVAGFFHAFSDTKYTCINSAISYGCLGCSLIIHCFIPSLIPSTICSIATFCRICSSPSSDVNHLVSLIACIAYSSGVILLSNLRFLRLCLLPSSVTLNRFRSTSLTSVYISV